MKFEIKRTSDWDHNKKPCVNATKIPKDQIKDEVGKAFWEIEINSIEELMELIKEIRHSVIIDEDRIEIYDDWRE